MLSRSCSAIRKQGWSWDRMHEHSPLSTNLQQKTWRDQNWKTSQWGTYPKLSAIRKERHSRRNLLLLQHKRRANGPRWTNLPKGIQSSFLGVYDETWRRRFTSHMWELKHAWGEHASASTGEACLLRSRSTSQHPTYAENSIISQPKETLMSHEIPSRPWEEMDMSSPMPDNKDYLVTVDY